MSTVQIAESAARSLQNALCDDWFRVGERTDLARGWRDDLIAAGLNPPTDYLHLLAFCEVIAGLRKAA